MGDNHVSGRKTPIFKQLIERILTAADGIETGSKDMTKNDKLLFYVKKGNQKLHPTQHLFAAQMARECMITCGEGDESMQVVDSDGKIYPNLEY